MEPTTEKKVADAVLQAPVEVVIGTKRYVTAPPSVATLILASEAVSRLPRTVISADKILEGSLNIAKDCAVLGEIVAILILGAKHLTETVKAPQIKEKRYLWGLIKFRRTVEVEQTVDRKAALTKELLENLSPHELHALTGQLLRQMEIADFFALTTFLIEVNLLQPTKVESETTAFGQ
jgi:hypothetical protein